MVCGFLSLICAICTIAAAQSVPPRKDIPAIAKAANGSIVSIVMSDKDGKPLGQGSGFFISKDGLIVTNYHVIAEGVSAIAKLPSGAFYALDGVSAFDKERDIALVKAHGESFRPLKLGNSDRVKVGEGVIAIGSPLSLESTVSDGIVSGVRSVEEKGGKYLQTTAPISPGSSGGPLFNMAGEVVGITTMYLKGGENLNFAIPINDVTLLLLLLHHCADIISPLPGIICGKVQAWANEVAREHESEVPPSAPTRMAGPMTAREHYEELRKAGEFILRTKAGEDTEVWKKGKEYRSLDGQIYACIPDANDASDIRVNFITFDAYRFSATKSASASPYVYDTTGRNELMFKAHRDGFKTFNVHLPINLDTFEELSVTTYVTGVARFITVYYRQGLYDQEPWLFGQGDIPGGNISINSATMRFSGTIPLLGGPADSGKCEKIFRRNVSEIESSSPFAGRCNDSGCIFGPAGFDKELREQGIEVRPVK